jgi:hypothetical protein
MMAGLFLLYAIVLGLIAARKRSWAMGLIGLNILLCLAMLWQHATDTLQINW